MRLLIITQKLDINDPILGFFHRWVEEFSKHCDKITVIALGVGEYNLPESVKVLSLGKETSPSRFKYLWRLAKYLWQERNNYDTVFVHMNQEYVLLAGWWWQLTGKKIWFWRNHPKGSWLTRVAVKFSHRLFCTSPYSFTAQFKKTELMPAGIDTEKFSPDPSVIKNQQLILCLGRISPVKKNEQLIAAIGKIKNNNPEIFDRLEVLMVGDALPRDEGYLAGLKGLTDDLGLKDKIIFQPGLPNNLTRHLYNQSGVYVNMTPSGSLDKTVLEAMACGTLTVVSNKSFLGAIDNRLIFEESNSDSLVSTLSVVLNLSVGDKKTISENLRLFVVGNHSLRELIAKMFLGVPVLIKL